MEDSEGTLKVKEHIYKARHNRLKLEEENSHLRLRIEEMRRSNRALDDEIYQLEQENSAKSIMYSSHLQELQVSTSENQEYIREKKLNTEHLTDQIRKTEKELQASEKNGDLSRLERLKADTERKSTEIAQALSNKTLLLQTGTNRQQKQQEAARLRLAAQRQKEEINGLHGENQELENLVLTKMQELEGYKRKLAELEKLVVERRKQLGGH